MILLLLFLSKQAGINVFLNNFQFYDKDGGPPEMYKKYKIKINKSTDMTRRNFGRLILVVDSLSFSSHISCGQLPSFPRASTYLGINKCVD
uniref:Uncharacterized protein n=1 Tax=Pararge aegeria TaxID=116150 RepID=S4NQU6_9NEOP